MFNFRSQNTLEMRLTKPHLLLLIPFAFCSYLSWNDPPLHSVNPGQVGEWKFILRGEKRRFEISGSLDGKPAAGGGTPVESPNQQLKNRQPNIRFFRQSKRENTTIKQFDQSNIWVSSNYQFYHILFKRTKNKIKRNHLNTYKNLKNNKITFLKYFFVMLSNCNKRDENLLWNKPRRVNHSHRYIKAFIQGYLKLLKSEVKNNAESFYFRSSATPQHRKKHGMKSVYFDTYNKDFNS